MPREGIDEIFTPFSGGERGPWCAERNRSRTTIAAPFGIDGISVVDGPRVSRDEGKKFSFSGGTGSLPLSHEVIAATTDGS